MAWPAWHGIRYGIVGMVRPGGLRVWYMVWPGRPGRHGMLHGMVWRAYHGIWYGLAGMAWYMTSSGGIACYMLWSGRHGI